MPISQGDRLGPYWIVSQIGEGGMGEVWKARDTRLDRDVAVKVSKSEFTARFEREARTIAALSHPHICPLYDVGPNYLVMELIDGWPLKGPLPLAKALEYAGQILDALDAAHRKGITHRDLKPANILVTKQGIKLLDFGLAKQALSLFGDAATLTTLSVAGQISGTLQYMAPEQLQAKEVDGRADIFAFGCILYEMLTGQPAFRGSNTASLIAAVLERDAPSASQVAPTAVDRVLRRCLEKDPEERWQNARDLKWELERAMAGDASAPVRPPAKWPLYVALFASALAATTTFLYLRGNAPAAPVHSSLLPPGRGSFGPYASYANATISPDGRRLVFHARTSAGKTSLWIQPLDAATAQALDGTEDAELPFWSPDSRSIGFFAHGKLLRVDAVGNPPLVLADAPDGRGGTWNSAGAIVFAPGVAGPLMKVSSSGGAVTPVTNPASSGDTAQRWPWFLPDGKHFLLTGFVKPGTASIRIASLDSRDVVTLMQADSNAICVTGPGQPYLLFLRQAILLAQPFDPKRLATTGDPLPVARNIQSWGAGTSLGAFSASPAGTLVYAEGSGGGEQLAWFDKVGLRTGILGEPGRFSIPVLSPDGKRVAVGMSDPLTGTSDVWLYDTGRDLGTRFTLDSAGVYEATWSPDGQNIIFDSRRKGHFDLFRKRTDGAVSDDLVYADQLDKFPTSWSPDGKFLLYYAQGDPKTGIDLWVLQNPMGAGGEPKATPFLRTQFNEMHGKFSPDGRWVAYTSNESGRNEVYIVSFPEGDRSRRIQIGVGEQPRWRQDGREVFYVNPERRLMATAVSQKTDRLEAGETRALFTPGLSSSPQYDVTQDGQRVLAIVPDQHDVQAVSMVQNWISGLKK